MQRRTNEWYQGLREASSEEDDVVELETAFSHHHKSASAWNGGASNKSPPLLAAGKASPSLWTDVQLEGGRYSGSNSSNSERSSVQHRTNSRSPPHGDGVTMFSSGSSS